MMRNIISIVCIFSFAMVSAMEYNEATKIIQEYVKSSSSAIEKTSDQCRNVNCCTISSENTCSLNQLKPDATNLVFPGGESRCIFSTSTPYSFQVIPGATDKLLVYFQGGGACWNKASTRLGMCTTDASPGPLIGIFDRDNKDNLFKDYTVVQLLYCSGDIWGGNVTRDYTDSKGQPVVQVGQINGQKTLDWIKNLQDTQQLSSTLSSLVVMGCSAGSIGAQLWAQTILTTLKWKQAAVIPDSYAGVFPEGSQGPLIADFGFCGWNGLTPELQSKCVAQTLTLQDINEVNQKLHNNIPYAFIQSKADIVQQAFYVAVAYSVDSTAVITPSKFYDDVNTIFGGYNKFNPNFLTYLVDGFQHCFTPINLLYSADGLGPRDKDSVFNNGITMIDWVNQFPLQNNATASTLCQGKSRSEKDQVSIEKFYYKYCSEEVSPKSFTEVY